MTDKLTEICINYRKVREKTISRLNIEANPYKKEFYDSIEFKDMLLAYATDLGYTCASFVQYGGDKFNKDHDLGSFNEWLLDNLDRFNIIDMRYYPNGFNGLRVEYNPVVLFDQEELWNIFNLMFAPLIIQTYRF